MSLVPVQNHLGRFLELPNLPNARDLGGLPLLGGGRTRMGQVFRSEAPIDLAPAEAGRLAELGIATVIDLREVDERLKHPTLWAASQEVSVHPIEIWSLVDASGHQAEDPWDLAGHLRSALDHAGAAFGRSVRLVAEAPKATLFHCVAGKDRTGLLAALMLETVGVPREVVIEDFALTHDRIAGLRTRLLKEAAAEGHREEDFARLLGATPELLAPTLEHLDHRYGGAEAYLRGHGVQERELGLLQRKLVG